MTELPASVKKGMPFGRATTGQSARFVPIVFVVVRDEDGPRAFFDARSR
jgi:hypothetical protein